jgi:hypothetical protein
MTQPAVYAVFPFVVGILLSVVAYGRWRRAIAYPLPAHSH